MIDQLIMASTCLVSCGTETGSGCLIGERLVLTARHCVIDAIGAGAAILVRFSDIPNYRTESELEARIVEHDAEFDSCVIELARAIDRPLLQASLDMPREGTEWRSFGYPKGKTSIGHRLSGEIAQSLTSPALKIDVDLSIDALTALEKYDGFSGAPLVAGGVLTGMVRLKLNGTLGAISCKSFASLLDKCGIAVLTKRLSTSLTRRLADRSDFQSRFEKQLVASAGHYIGLEGAHGIGKSTFASTFLPLNPQLDIIGAYCIREENEASVAIRSQPEEFYDWLLVKISTLISGKPARRSQRSFPQMVEEVVQLLDAYAVFCRGRDTVGVLFLDGLNELLPTFSTSLGQLVGLLPIQLPNNISVVVSVPNLSQIAMYVAPRILAAHTHQLPTLSEAASIAYCWQSLNEPMSTNVSLIDSISERAAGHPLYLNYLIKYVNENPSDLSLVDFPSLNGPIENYYEHIWQRLAGDDNVVSFLSLIARLRDGLALSDVIYALPVAEQSVFASTIARVKHLLRHGDQSELYHSSFRDFIVTKTLHLEALAHGRISDFCVANEQVVYCLRNKLFHFLRSQEAHRNLAVVHCNQEWVDACVWSGIHPDTLLLDIAAVVALACSRGNSAEAIRLLLLSNRVEFRYNSLFVESASLVSEALLRLGRPRDAVQHAFRHNILMLPLDDAIRLAYLAIRGGYTAEADRILRYVSRACIKAYSVDDLNIADFQRLSRTHVISEWLLGLAHGASAFDRVMAILRHVNAVVNDNLPSASQRQQIVSSITDLPNALYLALSDRYVTTAEHVQHASWRGDETRMLVIAGCLREHMNTVHEFDLSPYRNSSIALFDDLEQLLRSGITVPADQLEAVIHALIEMGAPADLVDVVAAEYGLDQPQTTGLRAANGVDVNLEDFFRQTRLWRLRGYLEPARDCPDCEVPNEATWQNSLERACEAVHFIEGRSLRLKTEKKEAQLAEMSEKLWAVIFGSLKFTLSSRSKWQRSYLIPEGIIPILYRTATSLCSECFPDRLDAFLQTVVEHCDQQLGLYTEGYRAAVRAIVGELLRLACGDRFKSSLVKLLAALEKHLQGLENRYELVPELLELSILYARLGAKTNAERVFSRVLEVSMGPSWYKEGQLGLMAEALKLLPLTSGINDKAAMVAGYLERASGEMTFQQYIRFDKSALIGAMVLRGTFDLAMRYFQSQVCGAREQLLSECRRGSIDKVTPETGYRFPGGGLDEQDGVLQLLIAANAAGWRLRWAILEIYLFGDPRHVTRYGNELANIINSQAAGSEALNDLIRRARLILGIEVPEEALYQFKQAVVMSLSDKSRLGYGSIFSSDGIGQKTGDEGGDVLQSNTPQRSENNESDGSNDWVAPGLFGKQSAIRAAEVTLKDAKGQLELGNHEAAKDLLIQVLTTIQRGGWNIWDSPCECSREAEQLLINLSKNAGDLLALYTPLILAESHAWKWKVADHLIGITAPLLMAHDGEMVFDYVISHIAVLVGDAVEDIAVNARILQVTPSRGLESEVFQLIIWLCDHPAWLRREKAAEVILWLIRSETHLLVDAAKLAFGMQPMAAADILCAAIELLSENEPLALWSRLEAAIDVTHALINCKHASRLLSLHRIAETAGSAGSQEATSIARSIEALLDGKGSDAVVILSELPYWAKCVEIKLDRLMGLGINISQVLKQAEGELARVVSPLTIRDAYTLENAVSDSFRTRRESSLGRWYTWVNYAVNVAVMPFISVSQISSVANVLRDHNPAAPYQTLTQINPAGISPAELLSKPKRELYGWIASSSRRFLHYLEFFEVGEDAFYELEIIAVVLPSQQRGKLLFAPELKATFLSTEVPNLVEHAPWEVCCRVNPCAAYFGSLTAAYALPSFLEMCSCDEKALERSSWKGRRSGHSGGRPESEGCMLAIDSSAMHIPDDKVLAWIIRLNGEVLGMVDSDLNERL